MTMHVLEQRKQVQLIKICLVCLLLLMFWCLFLFVLFLLRDSFCSFSFGVLLFFWSVLSVFLFCSHLHHKLAEVGQGPRTQTS